MLAEYASWKPFMCILQLLLRSSIACQPSTWSDLTLLWCLLWSNTSHLEFSLFPRPHWKRSQDEATLNSLLTLSTVTTGIAWSHLASANPPQAWVCQPPSPLIRTRWIDKSLAPHHPIGTRESLQTCTSPFPFTVELPKWSPSFSLNSCVAWLSILDLV